MNNLALNQPATANQSIMPFTPDRAVNGNTTPTSRWLGQTPGNWLRVDLGQFYWVNRWVVKMMGGSGWPSGGSTLNYNLYGYTLQGSNDTTNWNNLDTVTGNLSNSTDRAFTPGKYRYYRVYVNDGLNINKTLASIVELELYETATPPYLTNLAISAGTLTPSFNGKQYTYATSVSDSVSSITVTPTTNSAYGATIKVNGTVVQSGSPSAPITVNPGQNTISVQVTTPSGQDTYTIAVTKGGTNWQLSNLAVTNTRGTAIALNPTFNSKTFYYTATVTSGISAVIITPTYSDLNADINVTLGTQAFTVKSGQTAQLNLNTGINTITALVQGAPATDAYKLDITRQS
jgi:hypothetical protein